MSYTYSEPQRPDYEVLPPGQYEFVVTHVEDTYTNKNGNFVLPIRFQVKNTSVTVLDNPSAGTAQKSGKPYDMLAPFLKAIRRNPAEGEEPDFSAKNLIGAKGIVILKVEEFNGENQNKVNRYVYDKQQTTATVSGGKDAAPKTYNKPASSMEPLKPADADNIPF